MSAPRVLAPEVFRQRLLIEGYYQTDVAEQDVGDFLLGVAAALDLRTYGAPVVFAPASGMGGVGNAGFDGFVPLIDSGISVYVWTGPRFVSAVLYTCKGFDEEAAVAFTKDFFKLGEDWAQLTF